MAVITSSTKSNFQIELSWVAGSGKITFTNIRGKRLDNFHSFNQSDKTITIKVGSTSKNISLSNYVDFGAASWSGSWGMTKTEFTCSGTQTVTVTMPAGSQAYSGIVFSQSVEGGTSGKFTLSLSTSTGVNQFYIGRLNDTDKKANKTNATYASGSSVWTGTVAESGYKLTKISGTTATGTSGTWTGCENKDEHETTWTMNTNRNLIAYASPTVSIITPNANGGNVTNLVIDEPSADTMVSNNATYIKYGKTVTNFPIPTKTGYTFGGWYTTFNGTSTRLNYGRAYMFTDIISVHLKATASNWADFFTNDQRLISCTEGGGWNIQVNSDKKLTFVVHKTSGYVNATSTVTSLSAGAHTFDLVHDGTYTYGYIDGKQVAKSAANTNPIFYNAHNDIIVGAEAGATKNSAAGNYFKGQIGNIVIKHSNARLGDTAYSTFTVPAQNISVTALWTENTYKISYNANGGTGAPAAQTKKYTQNLTLSSTKPTRTGYTFSKWNTKADGTGTSYNAGATFTTNANTTLYAIWTPNKAHIAYHPNGGVINSEAYNLNSYGYINRISDNTPWFQTIAYDTQMDPYNAATFGLTRTGYKFGGWLVNNKTTVLDQDTKYDSIVYVDWDDNSKNTSNKADVYCRLYAKWIPLYTISYNANGGTGAPAAQTKEDGVNLTLSSTKPTKNNATSGGPAIQLYDGDTLYHSAAISITNSYTFKNWVSTSGDSYAPGAIYTKNEATTLTAQWNVAQTFNPYLLPTLNKTGYVFLGWSKTKGSKTVDYSGGLSYTFTAATTLYAVWKKLIYVKVNGEWKLGTPYLKVNGEWQSEAFFNQQTSNWK